jgi:hypothetical protein
MSSTLFYHDDIRHLNEHLARNSVVMLLLLYPHLSENTVCEGLREAGKLGDRGRLPLGSLPPSSSSFATRSCLLLPCMKRRRVYKVLSTTFFDFQRLVFACLVFPDHNVCIGCLRCRPSSAVAYTHSRYVYKLFSLRRFVLTACTAAFPFSPFRPWHSLYLNHLLSRWHVLF